MLLYAHEYITVNTVKVGLFNLYLFFVIELCQICRLNIDIIYKSNIGTDKLFLER